MNEDLEWVMQRIPSSSDIGSIRLGVQRSLEDGFSKEDALAYARLTEEVNPDLDESIALRCMKVIANQYPNRKKTFLQGFRSD